MFRRFAVAAAVIVWGSAIFAAFGFPESRRGVLNLLLSGAVCTTLMVRQPGLDDLYRRARRNAAAIAALYEGLSRVLAAGGQQVPAVMEDETPTAPMLRPVGRRAS